MEEEEEGEDEARREGVMVAEVEAEAEVMGGARSRITEAFWFETFRLIAGQKNFAFRLRDSGL